MDTEYEYNDINLDILRPVNDDDCNNYDSNDIDLIDKILK